jgi:hypothetical protein
MEVMGTASRRPGRPAVTFPERLIGLRHHTRVAPADVASLAVHPTISAAITGATVD